MIRIWNTMVDESKNIESYADNELVQLLIDSGIGDGYNNGGQYLPGSREGDFINEVEGEIKRRMSYCPLEKEPEKTIRENITIAQSILARVDSKIDKLIEEIKRWKSSK